jgi:hypothetical protein
MPQTWIKARNQYKYPVKLVDYQYANDFEEFFKQEILGDRDSTIAFEDYFRLNAQKIEVWCEVVFWKLYSQKNHRDTNTKKCLNSWTKNKVTGEDLYKAANNFILNERKDSFNEYRELWPFYKSRVIAVLATHISFLAPDRFPMVDTRIAKWVNSQLDRFNKRDPNGPRLIKSRYGQTKFTVLTMADFDFYSHWICWTRHTANKLSQQTEMKWRARDVEMAVFTAWGDKKCSHPRLHLDSI